MSKKHNAPHPERGRSRYSDRLAARGLKRAPALAEIEGTQGLRTRQERREKEQGHPWRYVNHVDYEEGAA